MVYFTHYCHTVRSEERRNCIVNFYRLWLDEPNALDGGLEFLPHRQVAVWPWPPIQGYGVIINCQWQNRDHSASNFLNGLHKLSAKAVADILGTSPVLRRFYIFFIKVTELNELLDYGTGSGTECKILVRSAKFYCMKRTLSRNAY